LTPARQLEYAHFAWLELNIHWAWNQRERYFASCFGERTLPACREEHPALRILQNPYYWRFRSAGCRTKHAGTVRSHASRPFFL